MPVMLALLSTSPVLRPSRGHHVLGLLACAAMASVFAACDNRSDADLWGDSMSPTQMQQMNRGPGPGGNLFTTTEGDSGDPFVDDPNYPFVQGAWWSNPAYNDG